MSQLLLMFRKKSSKFYKETILQKVHKKLMMMTFLIQFWTNIQPQLKMTNLWPLLPKKMLLKHLQMFGPTRKNSIVLKLCHRLRMFFLNFGPNMTSCRKMFSTIMKPTLCSRTLQSTNEGYNLL